MALAAKIFVSGGTGFVGAYVLHSLVERGYQNIYALYRPGSDRSLLDPWVKSIHWIAGDVLDIVGLERYLEGCEVVIHAAAEISYHRRDIQPMIHTNVQGTANVINAALTCGVKNFIMVSSIAAIGGMHKNGTIDEDVEWRDDWYHSQYAWSKYLAELEVQRGFAEGLSGSIVNPGVILGALSWSRGTGQFFKHIYHGLKFYPGGITGFVDVRDVIEAILRLVEVEPQNERYVITAENMSYHEVFKLVAQALGEPSPKYLIQPWMLKLVIPFVWIKEHIPGHKSTLTVDLLRNTAGSAHYNNRKSKEKLGLQYRSVAQSISETAQIFKEHYPQFKLLSF